MNSLKETEILNKVKRLANSLSGKIFTVSKIERANSFLTKIKGDISTIRKDYKKLVYRVKASRHLTHEVENLFDNYYVVEEALSEIINYKIDKDFEKLLQIEKKPGIPITRIQYILTDLLKVVDYQINQDTLYYFLKNYQIKSYLSVRELSFVPYFLKIILIKNIGEIIKESILSLDEYKDADYWFDQIVKKDNHNNYSKITSDLTLKYGVVPINLGFNLLQKLSQYGPDTRPISKWLKLNLLKQGVNINNLAEIENERQDKISTKTSNLIKSLHWINQTRWDDFVVDVNVIDSFLIKDPAAVYGLLDKNSQNHYRNEIVKISDKAGVYESEVAKLAIRLCQTNLKESEAKNNDNRDHVGYYLIGAGRDELEDRVGYQKSFFEKIQSLILKKPRSFYFGFILLMNIVLTFSFFEIFSLYLSKFYLTVLFFILFFIINLDIVINLVGFIISRIIPVRILPRLDLSSGLFPRQTTMVVIPSMFRDKKSAQELLRRLEINFLANRDSLLYFALLMDFKDAQSETLASDQDLVSQIEQGLDLLNKRYPSAVKRFYLFHRRRLWNSHENVFMGWERKRGKLREFNLLLRGGETTSYFESLPKDLPYIKYILTIDEDTRLPKDSAIKLIGCIDHPLNRPVVDDLSGQVISGYGIIQPKMTTKFNLARATIFSRLFSSSIGIDSYNGPTADLYQDLFNNSIFFGKGIYDIDTMEKTIGNLIPENQVLSHDLLEGLYTKVGFATDIFLFEGFPESYKEYVLRMDRWIRGDWQIISWLRLSKEKRNYFNFDDKWKIFDNLRRSNLPIFITISLFIVYFKFINLYPLFLIYILFVLGSSLIISFFINLFKWPKGMTFLMKFNSILNSLDSILVFTFCRFIFLLDQAVVSFRAITISWYRMIFSRKNLLRWQNSHEVSRSLKGTLREFIYLMFPTQITALILILILINYHNSFYAYLTLIFWFISPFLAYRISKRGNIFKYKDKDLKFLRRIAYRSAKFFLDLSNRDVNYLIPDHYQEEPITNSPAATSPTNIGMHLLSNLSAFDFGYISFSDFLDRSSVTFNYLNKLERYNGQFYNWYDIHTLKPLTPKYVSSVDSANFLLAILALKQGIIGIIKEPIISQKSLSGLFDVISVLSEDVNLIIKDKNVLKSDKKIAYLILAQTKNILKKISVDPKPSSISYLNKLFSDLTFYNEKFKKIISNLDTNLEHSRLSVIYSSLNHFNILLEQQLKEMSLFMSFKQFAQSRPVFKNTKNNYSLNNILDQISLKLDIVPSLFELDNNLRNQIENLDLLSIINSADLENNSKEELNRWYSELINNFFVIEKRVSEYKQGFETIISLIDKFFTEADFSFLYNKERGLFHIGYNVTFEKIDNSYYDFLASEANSVSFVSILKNHAPLKHWFYLGRKLVKLDSKNILLSSWGGSLFEYLTSLIFFDVHKDSLLGNTAELAIASHIKYGEKYCVPWGMGESAYSDLDINNNYQYRIFGHPSLGLKSDLKDFLVTAPYTVIMSLAFNPKKSLKNLKRLVKNKFFGRYGFYDAIDYTNNLNNHIFYKNKKQTGLPIKIYYAHHQGFSLQSLNNQINGNRIKKLFMSDPLVESLDTLFEERVPASVPARPLKNTERVKTKYLKGGLNKNEVSRFISVSNPYPKRAFISNGHYMANISNVGSGGSYVDDLNLNRFREDIVSESAGQFIYLFDTSKKIIWSPTTQPMVNPVGKNKIEFFENKAHFKKIFNDIESSLTITVSAEDNTEFRILTLTNHAKDNKKIKIASYGEVSLSKTNEDLHHTSFEKLSIKSEFWSKYKALVFTKPNKDKRNTKLYFAHKVLFDKPLNYKQNYITNREQFISRGGSLKHPNVFDQDSFNFKSNHNYNFDPIFCLLNEIDLKSNETITIIYINTFAYDNNDLIHNLKKYNNYKDIILENKKAIKNGQEILNNFGLSQEQALLYQSLASRLLAPNYFKRNLILKAEEKGEAGIQSLWRLGVSGNLPIILIRFYDLSDLIMIKNMLSCHRYLKFKGVAFDLVFLNEYPTSYIKSFEDEVDFLIRYNKSPVSKIINGGVFHIRSSHISNFDRESLLSLSKIVFDSKLGTVEQQILALEHLDLNMSLEKFEPIKKINSSQRDILPSIPKLNFDNGFGGFDNNKREYIININHKKTECPLAPWINIIANKDLGFIVTENGSMYTWLYNSYDNRLTKRIDDSLIDRSSEIFYLRDEETGEFWNPTPLPIKNYSTYKVTHGLGYTKFDSFYKGLEQSMTVSVPQTDKIKIINFKFKNKDKIKKRLSLTAFFEMSLGGANREDVKDNLETVRDENTGAIFVKNTFNESFKNVIAFIDMASGKNLVTNDRYEFLGKNGEVSNPKSMSQKELSNNIYTNTDHCVSLQNFFSLEAGEEKEINVLLGGGNSVAEITNLINKYRNNLIIEESQIDIKKYWEDKLNRIQIKTPDESLNILFNYRLIYQLMSSRLLARTGYYQPSGAYGFRDQLQDSMALVFSNPEITKEIILRASKHQFLEGDAQNWWHEYNSFGVRSIFSDHQLWLPYVVSSYLEVTGDEDLLKEQETYMKGPILDFINNSHWAGIPEVTTDKYDLYDHCLRAIERTFNFGKDGLPLIGKGDWNDGLNKVGEKGLGESVWLGWFLYAVIQKFLPYIKQRGDKEKANHYEITANNLLIAIEKKAWDGKWYKRAFFDDGHPLGSKSNREFKIDSISQSWAVLSGGAKKERAKIAMASVLKHLFQDNNLLALIYPPLKDGYIDPGYIKDYPPGVRENGAQYNHAALWSAQAFAKLGDANSLMRILDSVNPIKRSFDKNKASIYRVEPYVVSSEIYTKPSQSGRGGWTWYTGSAGIMYKTILESLLGLKISQNKMEINPCIPDDWKGFSFSYLYKKTKYNIKVSNNLNVVNKKIRVDGELLSSNIIYLLDDGLEHNIEIKL